jgi:predicted transport protein
MPTYVKPTPISLRKHPTLNERWVQDRLAEDPSLIGLGDVILRDRERPQPHAGRLDLLFQDAEESERFEVELQLGPTDETHIIRAIEYWDIERKRFPQYDHTAVIVAEQITSRFHNVISLFNGQIPLIAVQMQAIQVGEQVGLVFTKVLDRLERGTEEEDEGALEVTDRAYWERRAAPKTLALVDKLFQELRRIDPRLEPRYTKFYIGTGRDGSPWNIVVFRPKKKFLKLELKLERSEEVDRRLETAGLEGFDYLDRWNAYNLKLEEREVEKNLELLKDLMRSANEQRGE